MRSSSCAASILCAVTMSQRPLRRDAIAHGLLELLRLGEAPRARAREDQLAVEAHVEHAAAAGHERHLAELRLERRQQLLREPGRAQQPAALRAVLDLDARAASAEARRSHAACLATNSPMRAI